MKTMEIVFENCEYLTVDGEIVFDVTGEHSDGSKSIDNVKIIIPKSSNGIYEFPYGNEETTIINRLAGSDDITQIHIDGVCYYPVLYEENEYAWTQHNEYQHTYKTENGDLVIEISSANKQRKSDNERIVELITDYMQEYPTMTFGQVIGKLEKLYGGSIDTSINGTVVEMLEELLMEAI